MDSQKDLSHLTEVHAASFMKQRLVVLEQALLRNPAELRRILIHELFHFVWWRLGNNRRREWDAVLAAECETRARGELGWSAQSRKERLASDARIERNRQWREYICESFCDTAAWYFSRVASDEHTLAGRFSSKRRRWFATMLASRVLSI
jgi:hypothetical protein